MAGVDGRGPRGGSDDGSSIDLRAAQPGWDTSDFDDAAGAPSRPTLRSGDHRAADGATRAGGRGARRGADVVSPVLRHARCPPERRRLRPADRSRGGRHVHHDPTRRGPRARRRAAHTIASLGAGDGHVRPRRRRGHGLAADLHIPRVPLRRDRNRGGDPRRDRRRDQQRHGAAVHVRVRRSPAHAVPRERRLVATGQLRVRADGLSTARRAPRLDGRRPAFAPTASTLFDFSIVLVELAPRPRSRAGRRARRPERRPGRRPGWRHALRAGRLGRRRDDRAVGHRRVVRRPGPQGPSPPACAAGFAH